MRSIFAESRSIFVPVPVHDVAASKDKWITVKFGDERWQSPMENVQLPCWKGDDMFNTRTWIFIGSVLVFGVLLVTFATGVFNKPAPQAVSRVTAPVVRMAQDGDGEGQGDPDQGTEVQTSEQDQQNQDDQDPHRF
jgi:hypothetical protein